MSQEKQRIHDIRRRLEQIKLERARQDREFAQLEQAVAPADVQLAETVLREAREAREAAAAIPANYQGLRA
ncbi:MAG: hypothetical protein H6722_17270 [Sandaracinus sp.]|nr:hypothetical protein [Myxococcales bacterium]MCB9614191.1 hypothetical protein [Sandaracinus sp.]